MCLDVESEVIVLREASPKARKPHKCYECNREIEPGERHRLWVVIDWGYDNGLHEWRMCAHCWATIVLGSSLTGCPKHWWWDKIHSLDPEDGGFVGDILLHDLSKSDRAAMKRTVEGRWKGWRTPTGRLMKLPIDPWAAAS